MILTTKQVAAKLKVSKGVVRRLTSEGKLIDLKTTAEGAVRHQAAYDSKQVVEFIKTFPQPKANGHTVPTVLVVPPTSGTFTATLNRIEEKLDRLITMWS